MPDADVWITLDDGHGNEKRISPTGLLFLEPKIRTELSHSMNRIARLMLLRLRDGYSQLIRTSHRLKGEALRAKLAKAMTYTVNTPSDKVWMGVFDLALMDRQTRHEGFRTDYRGWFMLFEDGHSGLAHGTPNWDFIELKEAISLGEECIIQMKLKGTEAEEFRREVAENFQGRHGDGIMVNLNKPLFFKYPQFGANPGEKVGKAGNILGTHGHPGFMAWNLLDKIGGSFSYRRGGDQRPEDEWVFNEMDKALKRVFKEL